MVAMSETKDSGFKVEQYPLTHAQRRIWHVEQSHPGTSMWNNAGTLKIHGKLDFDVLDRAVQLYLKANESLRLRIRLIDGEPVQYVAPYRFTRIDRLDFSKTGTKGLYEWDTRQTQAPLSLIESPLYYFALAKTASDEGYLYAKMHHIISDGVSFVLLANEIMENYDRLLSGLEPTCSQATSYLAYVEEEQRYLASKRYTYDEAYWLERFSNLPEATLLKPRTSDYFGTKAKRKACVLPAEVSSAVREFCEMHRISIFVLMLSVFAVYLNRVLGKDDLVVSAPVSNRTFAGSSDRFGMYVSTVPVPLVVDNEQSFLTFAERVSNEWFSVLKHQRYPYDLLMQKIHETRGDIDQLYDISLSYQVGTFETKKHNFSYEGRWHFSGHQTSSINVHWNDRENNGRFVLDYDYLFPLFAAKEVDFIHEHVCNIVADAIAHPHRRLFELDMLSSDEHERVLKSFNDTDDGIERSDLVSLWRGRVAEEPAASALVYHGRTWSVTEVDRASDVMAQRLSDAGVVTGDVVALTLPRSDAYFVAALGILKTGAAFMPIDKALPEERVHYMLAESDTRFAVVGTGVLAGWKGALPASIAAITCDTSSFEDFGIVEDAIACCAQATCGEDHDGHATSSGTPASSFVHPDPDQAAYIIYTSGSTGTPKGVIIEHHSIAHFVCSMGRTWHRTQGGRMLCAGPISFDINVMEAAIGFFTHRTLVVSDDRQADYPDELCGLIIDQRVDMMMVTPGRMEMILSSRMGLQALRGFREIGLGADVLLSELLRKIRRATSSHITNFYGPTEITIAATCCDVSEGTDVNIGRPMNGVHVYILDPHQNPVPIGVPGELYVGGAGVGRGYVARDELTAERFIPSPFDPDERLYRTGDLGRWYPRGEIQFLGRIDQQVKIRGYRVELGEIQNQLLQIEGVRSAAVVAHEESDGRKYLCGYVVGEGMPPLSEIKGRLTETLPFYMVPTHLMELGELPLTSSEKLDRRRLPKPQRSITASRAPETDTERNLAEVWERLLGMSSVGKDDHFFEIGGDSLSIVRMIAEVADVFDVDIELEDVYRDPTLATCASLVDKAERGYRKPIRPVAAKRYYVATPTQQRMLFAASQDPDSIAYNVPSLFVFDDKLDEQRLRKALSLLIERHAVLRTSLVVRDGRPMQQIHRSVELPFESITCTDAQITSRAKSCVRPFDPATAPLMRLASIRARRHHALLFDFHHAVCDQAGFQIVLDDFAALYHGENLPPLVVDYKDCAVWMDGRRASGALDRHASFWRDQMAGEIPLLNLPVAKQRGRKRKGSVCSLHIPQERIMSFCSFVQAEKATFTGALLTAFGLVLSQSALQDDLVIGTPVSGRTQGAMQHTAGAFINTLPIRCRFAGGQSVRACFEGVNQTLGEAVSHQDYPFERIVADAAVERHRGRNPLFDAMLVFGKNEVDLVLDDHRASPRFVRTDTSKLDVTLFVYEGPTGLDCRLEYDRTLFSATWASRLLARFSYAVEILFDHPEKSLDDICVLPPEERKLVTHDFSATDRPIETRSLSAWIEDIARRKPDEEAVVAVDGRLTFAELDRRADRIAHALVGAGVGPGTLVALTMRRTVNLLPALFGIIKSGAAYLPVDPDYPVDRRAFMLSDSGAAFVLGDRASVAPHVAVSADAEGDFSLVAEMEAPFDGVVPDGVRVLLVEETLRDSIVESGMFGTALASLSEDDIAYVIYTSGSTGTPKGSRLTRRGVANLREAMADCIGYDPAWTAVSVTTMSFDIFIADALLPLTYGCRTVIADDEQLRQPHLLAQLLKRERVGFLQTTPSRMQIMVRDDAFAAVAPQLEEVVLAGEKPSLALVRAMKRIMPNTVLKNGYGPTEVTVYTSFQDMGSADRVSIGHPIANTHVYLLDDAFRPVPIGTYAEAYISGAGVSPGYIGRDDLNASRFLPDPFRPGNTMYRSGDICCFDESGELFIAGRVDHQVKIRGLRIEPGEIEAQLSACAGVDEAVVVVRGEAERKQLVAYYTGDETIRAAQLRAALGDRLPAYMVPVWFIRLDALPMTANGKLDRTKLPEPEKDGISCSSAGSRRVGTEGLGSVRRHASPSSQQVTVDQRRFLRIVGRVLGVKGVTLDDNVFEIGGDSLAVIAIQAQLVSQGWTLRTQDFYDAATLGDLFAMIRGQDRKDRVSTSSRPQNNKNVKTPQGSLPFDPAVRAARNAIAATPVEGTISSFDRVFVTGATGFLGAHMVAELAHAGARDIRCLVRGKDEGEAQMRLDRALAAYGIVPVTPVRAIRGDVADDLKGIAAALTPIDAVFHCAALTEHVGKRSDYERVNIDGTRHVLEFARKVGASFLHVSTVSVAGTGGTLFDERAYDVGQDVTYNEYARSKFLAEGVVLDAFAQGMPGRLFRVGNLTGRVHDGVFQREVRRNAFAMRLAAFAHLGCYPFDIPLQFDMTPVDACAHAIVLLSLSNGCFPGESSVPDPRIPQVDAHAAVAVGRIAHVRNDQRLDVRALADMLGVAGYPVEPVAADVFSTCAISRSETDFGSLFGVMRDIVEGPGARETEVSSRVTSDTLRALGFVWPTIDAAYFARYFARIADAVDIVPKAPGAAAGMSVDAAAAALGR